jgi:short-subunit dehydrogenase
VEDLIRVQVLAVTRLTRALLPGLIRSRDGAIINVSSRLALSAAIPSPPLPNRTVYAATKAYINAFTQLLHSELAGTGVRVQALCPGLVRTEFFERMGIDPISFPAAMMMTPEAVVEASLAGLRLGEVVCMPGLDDANILVEVEEAQRRVFDHSNSSVVAGRYGARL